MLDIKNSLDLTALLKQPKPIDTIISIDAEKVFFKQNNIPLWLKVKASQERNSPNCPFDPIAMFNLTES